MRYFLNILTVALLGLLLSCVDNKEQAEEQEEAEFESDVVVGQEQDEIRLGEGSVVATVDDNESLRFLKDALRTTDLDSVLSQEGPYTLFAPSDFAFEKLDPTGQNNLPDDLEATELKEILLHHVVEGKYRAADLTDGQTLTTLDGGELQISMESNELTIGDSAAVVFADREADNGYVHIIDQVLMPN